ncbi:unnamed protein product [Colletotrichum noveboracense]|uniref:Uncharacterized protein n=1 Tax=Colletotrichum noveboracense TaxID=2664923 RepID=A0A9W4RTV3_9PEZI|nr:unnamed protein product [Colletotrichum noveboracense]
MSSKAPKTSGSETDVNVRDELPPSTGEVLGSAEPHVFSNPRLYESATYEGRHRFNAVLTWSAEEEKRLKKKVTTSEHPDSGTHQVEISVMNVDFLS